MKKPVNKQAKKASKLAKAENLKKKANQIITVKNAEGDPDTTAEIVIQNKINYEPKVSVIIPVYNVEQYLRECLDSVVNQTLKEIEIICVDDGSTDSSLEILKEYAKKDNRITVMKQENLHAGVARNAGLAVARGEYVHFLDSDDWVDSHTYKELYDIIKEKKVNIIKFKSYSFDNQTQKIVKNSYTDMDLIKKSREISFDNDFELAIDISDAPWSGMYKRDFLGDNIKFDSLICANDASFYFRCLVKDRKLFFIDKKFVYYRVNNQNSLVGIRALNFDCQIKLFYIIKEIVRNECKKYIDKLEDRFSNAIFWRFKSYISDDNLNPKVKDNIKNLTLSFFRENCHLKYAFDLNDFLSKNSDCKISVIIPVYNVEKYLPKCLDSVINQTLKEIEIICVDDGSTDNSINVLEKYSKIDERIKILRQTNKKAGAARNLGIHNAIGKYIFFMDSDDWIDNNCLEKLYIKISEEKSDICIYGMLRYDNETQKVTPNNYFDTSCYKKRPHNVCTYKDIKNAIFRRFGPVCKLYKKSIFSEYDAFFQTGLIIGEDVLTHIKCILLAKKISILDENLYYYRVNRRGSSMTDVKNSLNENIYDVFLFIEAVKKFLLDNNFYYELENNFIDFVLDQLCFHVSRMPSSSEIKTEFIKRANKLATSLNKELVFSSNFFDLSCNLWLYKTSLSTIPVILAADNNYALFMYTTMISILENSSTDAVYDFYLMVPSSFSKQNEARILSLKEKYNCQINFIDMKKFFSDLTMQIGHITLPTYYRLLAANLLPKEYDKCIYLDVDVCVCKDLIELFNVDLQDKLIAGVVAAGYYFAEDSNCKRLNLPTMKQYVNAGVLLMNLKQIRQNNITQKFVELSKKNYSSQDQDVINVACYGRILTLPPKYNAMVGRLKENDMRLRDLYSEKDIHEAKTNPCIIHYADKIKPWNDLSLYMSNYWWKYASKAKGVSFYYRKNLEDWYKRVMKEELNLDNPQTFNEKIQWLKLYDSTPIKTKLADKYLVRDWVKDKIGEEYLIPLLGVYDKFEDIDFDKLPNKFVIKCNHGCAYNIIVKDKSKLDLSDVKAKLDKWMNENFAFKWGVELHYRDIQPKIIIEKFIENKTSGDLYDYKFWCFNGKVHYIQFLSERNLDGLKMAFYDKDWKKQHFVYSHPLDKKNIQKPDNLQKMIELAEKLSQGFNHVRVDFYRLDDGTIYFGEMTFTSASGSCKWNDEKINKHLGNLIKIPKLAYNIDTGEYYKLPKKSFEKKHASKIKAYIFFPYYLFNVMIMRRKLNSDLPSKWFSIRDYGEKVVYRILGFKLSLKKQKLKFLYDKVKTDTYTKTYICGICVKKKPANVFNFIDSRVCNLSNQLSREINKQTQLIENKLKLIENKQIDLANNIKKEIDNIASLQNNLEAKVKEDILSVSEANLFELNKINEEISTNKEKLVALEDLIIGASQQINDTINSTEGFLADKIINLEEISANKEKLVALEDLIIGASQQINDTIVSSITANSDNIAKLQSVLRSSGSDIASEISALYKEHSSQLQSVKEQSISNRADIVAKLENNANEIQGLKEQAQSNRTDIVAKLDEFDANINDAKKDIIDKCQDLNCSEMLRNLKEQAQSNRTDIVAKLENNNNSISEFRKDILNKYQELNYADLLHDSIVNSSWLKDKTFSLFGWAANYSFIYTLFRILDKASPKNILEMGLGQTTRLTSQYVAFGNNDAKLNVCEHDQNWIDIYRNELPKSDNIQLNHFELEYFDFDGKQNDKYKDMPKVVGDKKFDLIIVDGPVGGGKNLPRSNVIDLIPNNLAEDFVIIIDDTERDGEQRTIRKIKEKLNECNIKYSISERRALKGQTLITSVSRDFVKFL